MISILFMKLAMPYVMLRRTRSLRRAFGGVSRTEAMEQVQPESPAGQTSYSTGTAAV